MVAALTLVGLPAQTTPATARAAAVVQAGSLQWQLLGGPLRSGEAHVASTDTIRFKATFTPVRQGRRVQLQHQVDGVWKKLAESTQNAAGTAWFNRRFAVGERNVRAITLADGTLPGRTTPPMTVATYQRGVVSLVPDGLPPGGGRQAGPFLPESRWAVREITVPGPHSGTSLERIEVRDHDVETTVQVPLPAGKNLTTSGSVADDGEVVYVAAACTWEWVWYDDRGGEGGYERRCAGYGIWSWDRASAPVLLRAGFTALVSPDGSSLVYAATGPTPQAPLARSPLRRWDRAAGTSVQITPTGYVWGDYRASDDQEQVVVEPLLDGPEPSYLWRRGVGRTDLGPVRLVAISSDGSTVAAVGGIPDRPLLVRDVATGTVRSWPGAALVRPVLDAVGGQVAWTSDTPAGQTVLTALDTGRTQPVSCTSAGVCGDEDSRAAGISADGDRVYFVSRSTNLDPADTERDDDLFRWTRP